MPAHNTARSGIQLARDLFEKGQLVADERGDARSIYMIVTLPRDEFTATYGTAAHASVFIGGTWLVLELGGKRGVTCLFSQIRLELELEETRFGGAELSLSHHGRKLSIVDPKHGLASLRSSRGMMRLARSATKALARLGLRSPFRPEALERPLPPILVLPEERAGVVFDPRAVHMN